MFQSPAIIGHQSITHHRHKSTHTHTHTYYGQPEGQTNLGLRRDLALVDAAVLLLHVANLQLPVVAALDVLGLEPLVVRVRHDADGQDVQVSLPDP